MPNEFTGDRFNASGVKSPSEEFVVRARAFSARIHKRDSTRAGVSNECTGRLFLIVNRDPFDEIRLSVFFCARGVKYKTLGESRREYAYFPQDSLIRLYVRNAKCMVD